MQNLLDVVTECKEVALRHDSVGSSRKSLSSCTTRRIGLNSLETTYTAEYFSAHRV